MATLALDPLITADLKQRYLNGFDIPTIAAATGLPRFIVYGILDDPEIKAATAARVASLQNRVVEFKLRAFDAAEEALAKLAYLEKNAADESLQRKAANDLVRIAGLEPRKIVRIMGHMDHSIDAESKEWFGKILEETGMRQLEAVDAVVETTSDDSTTSP